MKRNDASGEFCLLYIEPSDDKVALYEVIEGQKKPVVLMLPEQFRPRIFQRPEDFADLKYLKRQLDIPIIFVIAGNEHLRQLATRYGFPAYTSIEALSRALTLGQVSVSRQRTLAKTGPLSPHFSSATSDVVLIGPARRDASTSGFAQAEGKAGTPPLHSMQPAPLPVASRKTVPLSPMEQSPFKPATSPNTPSSPLPPVNRKTSSPLPQVKTRKKRRRLPVVLTILLLLVLGGAGLGSFLVFFHRGSSTDPVVLQSVGHIYFLSSGQVTENSNQGIDDEVQIDLHNLAQPAPGKSYYAWLLSDQNSSDTQSIFLGSLPVRQGVAQLLYRGDQGHTNLLAITSRFLITEEDASPAPISPSPDYSAWRYYGEFPQTPDSRDKDHYSFLDHLRQLLATDPLMNDLELPGGLNSWFYRNTSKLIAWTVSARDTWEESKDMNFIRGQAISILSYLDGLSFLQQDMPPNTPMPTLSRLATVGLLDMNNPNQGPSSYLSSIVYHLTGLINAPGSPPALRKNAATILTAMSNVRAWLEQLHDNARQIAGMTNDQLGKSGSLTLLNAMVDEANNAYAGQSNVSTSAVSEGVMWIHDALQALATLDVTNYVAIGSAPEIVPGTNLLAGNITTREVGR
ncbi:MAG TPA: hypothetical protein VF043_39840 [Ktedonobacteraceae bacterium]